MFSVLTSSPGEGLFVIVAPFMLMALAVPPFIAGWITGGVCARFYIGMSGCFGSMAGILAGVAFGWLTGVLLTTLGITPYFHAMTVGTIIGVMAAWFACWLMDFLNLGDNDGAGDET